MFKLSSICNTQQKILPVPIEELCPVLRSLAVPYGKQRCMLHSKSRISIDNPRF